MLNVVHNTLTALFFVIPVAGVLLALVLRVAGHRRAIGSFLLTTIAGITLAIVLNVVYARVTEGRILFVQVAITTYFAIGLLLILKCFDWLLLKVAQRVAGVRRRRVDPSDARLEDATELVLPPPSKPAFFTLALMQILRITLLFGLGLPFVMASAMVFRPKVGPVATPLSLLGLQFERTEFAASDGTKLVGWWIPAPKRIKSGGAPNDSDDSEWGTQTVLVCHGLAASKSNQLVMARGFPDHGYNVLIFDFRAHGESGGQLTTFGDLERRDVLAAVHYLREHRKGESQRILGVGASMGAAALIAAAADPSPDGQAIDAVAVYGTYSDLGTLADNISDLYFAQPMKFLLKHLAIGMASVETGDALRSFAPAKLVSNIWPRPILMIHGIDDEIIPFERGRDLFEAASLPKMHIWLPRKDHNSIIADDATNKAVIQFFDRARDVPVI